MRSCLPLEPPQDQYQALDSLQGLMSSSCPCRLWPLCPCFHRTRVAWGQALKSDLCCSEVLDKVGGIIYAHLIDGETEALPNEVISPKLDCMPQHVCVLFPTLLEMVQAEKTELIFFFPL